MLRTKNENDIACDTVFTACDILDRIRRTRAIAAGIEDRMSAALESPAPADGETRENLETARNVIWKLAAGAELARQISRQEGNETGWDLDIVLEALDDTRVLSRMIHGEDDQTVARCMASKKYLHAYLKQNLPGMKMTLMNQVTRWKKELDAIVKTEIVSTIPCLAQDGVAIDEALDRLNRSPDLIRFQLEIDATDILPDTYIIKDNNYQEYLYVKGKNAWSQVEEVGSIKIGCLISGIVRDGFPF